MHLRGILVECLQYFASVTIADVTFYVLFDRHISRVTETSQLCIILAVGSLNFHHVGMGRRQRSWTMCHEGFLWKEGLVWAATSVSV